MTVTVELDKILEWVQEEREYCLKHSIKTRAFMLGQLDVLDNLEIELRREHNFERDFDEKDEVAGSDTDESVCENEEECSDKTCR